MQNLWPNARLKLMEAKCNPPLFFDEAATTKPSEEVLDSFLEASRNNWGNPHSLHAFGYKASKVLEGTRFKILQTLGLEKTHALIFTSGATEANNLAIKGVARHYVNRGRHLISDTIEHPSVLHVFESLREQEKYRVDFLGVDREGKISLEEFKNVLDKETILVSFMSINNETGSCFPLDEIHEILKEYPKALFHSDITQSIGKTPHFSYKNLDLLSFSAHKIGGLKGSGALIYRKNIAFRPLFEGGGQESGFRSGTVDVPSAIALSKALEIAIKEQEENYKRVENLSKKLRKLLSKNPEILINSPEDASPYIFNFSLLHKKASVVVEALSLRGIYVSSMSACSSKKETMSHVLLSMGYDKERASNAIRVSFSAELQESEIDYFAACLETILKELKDR